jgi:hypothetical protein
MRGHPPPAVRGAQLRCLDSLGISVSSTANALALSLLKQIIKRRPRTTRPQTRRSRSFLLPRHPNFIQLTRIPLILLRNPLFHRLHALKPAPRIEIRTLLARMQLKPALRTLPVARNPLQHGPTLRTTGNRARARQIDRARTKGVIPLRRSTARLLSKLLSRSLARLVPIPILIPMLPVFSHEPSPPTARIVSPTLPGRQVAGAPPPSRAFRERVGILPSPGLMSRVFRQTWEFSLPMITRARDNEL